MILDDFDLYYSIPSNEPNTGPRQPPRRRPEQEPESELESDEEDYSSSDEDDISMEKLEKRMWRDRVAHKKLLEAKGKDAPEFPNRRQYITQEQVRRKKMSMAKDEILRCMLKMMEVFNAQGFVYGIIPEKGKPVSGASDNLREWWKDKVRFNRNGPAAIAKYQHVPNIKVLPQLGSSLVSEAFGGDDCSEYDVDCSELSDKNLRKRKWIDEGMKMIMENPVYTCEFPLCPYSKIHYGFHERAARDNHRLSCPWRPSFDTGNNPAVGPPFDLGSFGISEDDSRAINGLLSGYDDVVEGNSMVNNHGLLFGECNANPNPNLNSSSTDNIPVMFGLPYNMSPEDCEDGYPEDITGYLAKNGMTMF